MESYLLGKNIFGIYKKKKIIHMGGESNNFRVRVSALYSSLNQKSMFTQALTVGCPTCTDHELKVFFLFS